MKRTPEDIRHAMDTVLSGASHDPTLYHRVVNASKGDIPPVKKKLTLSMALVLILVLTTSTIALAAAYRGVQYFLTERTCEPQALDPDYLMSSLQQSSTSKRLNAAVVDAYWDGSTLSIVYRITAANPSHTVILPCDTPTHEHYRPNAEADVLLSMPDFINITVGNEIIRPFGSSADWLYEEDGTLTIMSAFTVNDMSEPIGISIPISNTLLSDGTEEFAMLHCSLPALVDPITAHEHDWLPATCVSPMTCSICERTEGGLGKHNFLPKACNVTRTCPICTYTYEAAHSIDPDTGSCYCGLIHE